MLKIKLVAVAVDAAGTLRRISRVDPLPPASLLENSDHTVSRMLAGEPMASACKQLAWRRDNPILGPRDREERGVVSVASLGIFGGQSSVCVWRALASMHQYSARSLARAGQRRRRLDGTGRDGTGRGEGQRSVPDCRPVVPCCSFTAHCARAGGILG